MPRRTAPRSILLKRILVVLLSCESAAIASAPRELDLAFSDYLQKKGSKAFALAVGETGAWAFGSAWGLANDKDAQKSALKTCEKTRRKNRVDAPCEILAVANVRVRAFSWPVQEPSQTGAVEQAPTAPQTAASSASMAEGSQDISSGTAPISYGVRWVEGTSFVVGATSELQLWVSFTTGRDPQALFLFTNGSERTTTIYPGAITALAIQESKKGPIATAVAVLSPEDYERKIRTKLAWEAALFGAAAALANRPQPQSLAYQGGFSAYQPDRPRNDWQGTYYGQITVWPTAADYAEANARTGAQLNAMGEQLRSSYVAMTSSLLKNQTMDPHSFYGGVVHFARFKGEKIQLDIPFADAAFRATFTLP